MSLNIGVNLTRNYSINFDLPKRKKNSIKFIIIHYTGMNSESEAIKRLCDSNSKVSSHYFIKNNGELLNLVPDLYNAWHSGKSSWKKFKSLNRYSIGIEINNPGHEFKYKKYSSKQILSLIKLLKNLKKKYKIKKENILGHSDISPDRKKDPGEKFPWKYLYSRKIGHWHNLNQSKLLNLRNQILNKFDKNIFIKNLYKIGYSKKLEKKNIQYRRILTIAFQRRFRQGLVNGVIDKECLIISENLIKKFK